MKPPTLRDIAAAAGVSHVTVSLSLRNERRIPAETRERIRAVADAMGYRPNPLMQALSSRMRAGSTAGYSPVIAFINPYSSLEEWQSKPTLQKFYAGAAARAKELGYTLESFWLGAPGMTARRLSGILEARGIHGAILGILSVARGHVAMVWDKLAIATQGYTIVRPALHGSGHLAAIHSTESFYALTHRSSQS